MDSGFRTPILGHHLSGYMEQVWGCISMLLLHEEYGVLVSLPLHPPRGEQLGMVSIRAHCLVNVNAEFGNGTPRMATFIDVICLRASLGWDLACFLLFI